VQGSIFGPKKITILQGEEEFFMFFMTCARREYCCGDLSEDHAVGRPCGSHGRNDKCRKYNT
jgi:hypothetical protein